MSQPRTLTGSRTWVEHPSKDTSSTGFTYGETVALSVGLLMLAAKIVMMRWKGRSR